MNSSDDPGSPRKKLKYEAASLDGSAMDISGTDENVTELEGNIVPTLTTLDHTIETQAQQKSSNTSNHHNLPATHANQNSAAEMTSLTSTTETANDQSNKEKACGIIEFVSSSVPGFSGVLKKRYTDFLVNEILPSGEVVHLTSLKPVKKEKPSNDVAKKTLHESEVGKETLKAGEPLQEEPRLVEKGVDPSMEIQESHDASSFVAKDGDREEIKQEGEGSEVPYKGENKHEETPPPHKRAAPSHLATEPQQGTSPKTSPTKETRTRQQFHLRHTDQGWQEFDKERQTKEGDSKEGGVKLNSDATTDANTAEEVTGTPPKKVEMPPREEQPAATRLEQPQMEHPKNTSPQAKWQAYADPNAESASAHKISDQDKELLLSYFTEPVVDAIRSLYNRVLNSPRRATRDYGTVKSATIDRQLRTKIHQDIRRIFQSRLETMTDNDGAMIISAMPPVANNHQSRAPSGHDSRKQSTNREDHQNSRGHTGGSKKRNWQELGGDFLHFTLYKENKDTMECISWLAKFLKLGPRAFEFAGTKDRRAVTVQRVSVYRQNIGHMMDAGRSLRQAYIGDFEHRPRPLQLGELTGNEFTITLRNCTFNGSDVTVSGIEDARSVVSNALRNLVEEGFINYYGLQRFGTFAISTADVGIKLLQGDFQGAAVAILHYNPESLSEPEDSMSTGDRMSRDDQARSHAIHAFQTTGKSQRVLIDLPKKFSAESAIIRHLGNKPNQAHDYLGAIQSIQRNLRLMYVHAYQSLVWNMAASKRWSLYGRNVVEGDLVLVDEHTNDKHSSNDPEEIDDEGEVIVKPAADDRATNVEDLFTRARALSKDEASSGTYTIFDVVLPTPGFDILYPANKMKTFYEEFMSSPQGGGLNPHNMRRPQRDFSLSGSYRKVLARPGRESSFTIEMYSHDDEQFVETDMDRLNKIRHAAKLPQHQDNAENKDISISPHTNEEPAKEKTDQAMVGGEATKADSDEDTDDISGGVSLRKIAVVLKLQLGTSQYATMALRELMKNEGVKTYKPDFSGGR